MKLYRTVRTHICVRTQRWIEKRRKETEANAWIDGKFCGSKERNKNNTNKNTIHTQLIDEHH